jgi:tRNA threonylcarbamoyladenosine biosynthesis protein TsaB
MRILVIETSTDWCSVAVGDGVRWHARDELAGQAHSERALVHCAALLAEAGWPLSSLDGIAFGAGPGSFTGIRIACGLAQGLSLADDLPVVPVPTLAALAQSAWTHGGHTRVVACLDARMREVYVAVHERRGETWHDVAPPAVLAPAMVAPPVGTGWFGAGNGFHAYPALAPQLGLSAVDEAARPTAQAVGELALPRLVAGEGVAAGDALPIYVRHRVALTTAERAAGGRL